MVVRWEKPGVSVVQAYLLRNERRPARCLPAKRQRNCGKQQGKSEWSGTWRRAPANQTKRLPALLHDQADLTMVSVAWMAGLHGKKERCPEEGKQQEQQAQPAQDQ
ncbi:hypothetical protein DYE50_12115 [Treponema ruminis]|nr:hypothetical protein DYE50_12115 [Treponema ruminis]